MSRPGFPKTNILISWISVLLTLVGAQRVAAQEGNQAGLVIVHGNGQVVTRCVQFSEPEISGYDVLARAGLDLNIEAGGTGAAICRIDNEGCTYPQQSCFCGTEGDSYIYWSYWHWNGAAWQYSNLGASNTRVQPGAVEGWIWGTGNVAGATPPPPLTLAEICAPPTPTPTATATATPTATATATPLPTATATPIPSPTPTATALPPPTLPPLPPRIDLFSADPSSLRLGETVLLRWNVNDAITVLVRAETGETAVAAAGELRLAPLRSLAYTLVARNNNGETTATVNVVVDLPTATSTVTALPTTTAPLSLPTAIVSPTATLAPPTATWTMTPLPTATLVAPTATLSPTNTPVPTNTPAPTLALEATPPPMATATMLPPTPTATATATNQAVALVPAISAPPAMPPTEGVTQQQVSLLLVAVGLVVALPLGLLCLVGLLWLLRRSA